MRGFVVGLVMLLGCTEPNKAAKCTDGSCMDPEFPFCDVDGVISGTPGQCLAVSCSPGEAQSCVGEQTVRCNAEGNGYERIDCQLGCVEAPAPHCSYIEPRYVPDACDAVAAEETFLVSSSASFDPNLDSNCNGGVVDQPGSPGICVMRYRTISIPSDATLSVVGKPDGSPGRSVALVVDELLSLDGVLDLSAHGTVSGPGGGIVSSGGKPLVTTGTNNGGGGAGGRTAGADGGGIAQDGGADNGGLQAADPAFLAALIGGASANQDPVSGAAPFGGGGGGGAATLVACRGRVSITGTINAGGGGGSGGIQFFSNALPGSGGGAGGNVVIQASDIDITGRLFANGGGGGGGTNTNQTTGGNGTNGGLSSTNAAAGGPVNGGAGGVGANPPQVGRMPGGNAAASGGGGGSVGFLQIYVPEGTEPRVEPSEASPPLQPTATIGTR